MSNSYIKKSNIKGLVLDGENLKDTDIRVIYRKIEEQENISLGYKDIQITISLEDIKKLIEENKKNTLDRRITTNER